MGAGKKNLKATKKFEKNHLKGVLDKRKANAKVKQRYQVADKRKARKTKDSDYFKGGEENEAAKKTNGAAVPAKGKGKNVADMSVDDFFKGGYDDIIEKEPAKLGKRKRSAPKEATENDDEDEGSDSGLSIEEQPVMSDSDENEDEEEEDGLMSKKTMDDLAQKDPEFYKFLKENDPEALDFDDDADLAEVDDLSADEDQVADEGEEEEQPKKKRKKAAKADEEDVEPQANELTRETIAGWRKSMAERHSLRAARQVVLAFRCAARLNEDDEDGTETPRWVINSPEVFNDILLLALNEVPVVMNHHLPVKESAAGRVYVSTEGKKFKTLSLLLRSHTTSIMQLLSTLSDEKTLKLTLSSLTPLLPYLLSFKKLVRALAKTVIGFWAQPASTETTRLTAFLVLRRLVNIADRGIREMVLKATYQGLIQGCRITNHNTAAGINLMKNSAAELWGVDPSVGYTTAFTFIRQLAIHLRNSIVHNKNDAFRMVYNWQYTHSLDFWSCVLAEHCSPSKEAESGKENQLKLLIYPLVQVTLGALRLIPTAIYFPLRFHLIRSLLRISRATGTYIPLASPLLEVLNSAEMRKPPKASTLKAFDFAVSYKAPKSYLRTRVYQDGVGDQVIDLMGEYFLLWSTSIAFPELALPVTIQLKRWLKHTRSRSQGNKNNKLASSLSLLVQKLEANAKFIEEKRARVDFAPRDRTQVEAFLRDFEVAKTPLGAFVVAQRKLRAERAKLMDEARKDEDKARREDEEAEKEGMQEDDDEEEAEEDDEELDMGDEMVDDDEDEDDE